MDAKSRSNANVGSRHTRWLFACAWLVAVVGCGGAYRYPAPRSAGGENAEPAESIATTPIDEDLDSEAAPSLRRSRPAVPLGVEAAAAQSFTLQANLNTAPGGASKHKAAGAPSAALAQLESAPLAPASANAEQPPADAARRPALIYDARLNLAVFEADRAVDAAEHLAQENGGYLVHRSDRVITFRVPAERFEAVLASATQLGDVLHREVSVRDVSDELRDLELRLRNALATRERLEQLLARADKVEETLEVARELERVVGEIEQFKGRLKVLTELVAFSTITLEFQARSTDQVESIVRLPFPWLDHLGLGELLRL